MLLKRVDRKLGRTAAIGGCIRESRQQVKVKHSYAKLCGQRIFGLALGYSDANDAGRIGGDPMMRMMIGRDPVPGADLASQRTVSRFKNAVSDKDLYRIGMTMAEKVVGYHGQASWPPGRADYHHLRVPIPKLVDRFRRRAYWPCHLGIVVTYREVLNENRYRRGPRRDTRERAEFMWKVDPMSRVAGPSDRSRRW